MPDSTNYQPDPRLKALAAKGSLAEALTTYMANRGEMPELGLADLPGNVLGAYAPFARGKPSLALNRNSDATEPSLRATYAHELAHATDDVLAKQAGNLGVSGVFSGEPYRNQFQQAFGKLVYDPDGSKDRRQELVQALGAQKYPGADSYRLGSGEVIGHAAGSYSQPNSPTDWKIPHLDATAMTELSILLELAQRKKK